MKGSFNIRANNISLLVGYLLFISLFCSHPLHAADKHQELLSLFAQWRSFEVPPMHKGAPDYRQQTFNNRYPAFQTLKQGLHRFDRENWSVSNKVDWHILLAEMNGFDFNHRILKPWVRDPAFYKSIWMAQSDVPAHEGPTHHGAIEIWQYQFPLSKTDEIKLTEALLAVISLNAQGKINLRGNARELWITGIRDIRTQIDDLDSLQSMLGDKASEDLKAAIISTRSSTRDFVVWLEKEGAKKSGPSGIGKENYTWYQQNVHMSPLTWEDEVRLLTRELDRAWSSLKLEETRNSQLPPLVSVANQAEYAALAEQSINKMMTFLKEKEIVTVKDYFEPALRAHKGQFVPEKGRHFFHIGSHLNPLPLFSHFYHWFELAIMQHDPHKNPIRTGALLYNIFDTRSEGVATAVEEMFMHGGLYDDNPRAREIVWILIAQRAARGLGSLYAHANEMTMVEAGKIHMNWTPRGWMKTEPELLIFEQHLYLRQPGYGTSYITGKYLLERTMADYAKMKEDQGKPFILRDFMDELNAMGGIPLSLGRWQMTGLDDDVKKMLDIHK
ncbi:MAG: hypothetical protein ACI965_001144 [Paraglaciecola sp.]|jgi:hypothetical protein